MILKKFGLIALLTGFFLNPFNSEVLAEHKRSIKLNPTSIIYSPKIEDKRGKLPTNSYNPSQISCDKEKRIYEKDNGEKKNILLYDWGNLTVTNLTPNMKGDSIDPKINCDGNGVFFKNDKRLYYIDLNQTTEKKIIQPVSGEESVVGKYLINEIGEIVIYEGIPKGIYEGEKCVKNIFFAVPKRKFSESLTIGRMRKELINMTSDGKKADYWIYLIETPTEFRRAQRTATLEVMISQAYGNSKY
jgi:hypothetical protein|tara:strand:- start:2366 stop:3100 length:735 start_codon:yes stop_codon:yes gene_type:complete